MSVRDKVMKARFDRNFDVFMSTINRTGTLLKMSDADIIALAAVDLSRHGSPLSDKMFDIAFKQLDEIKTKEVKEPQHSQEEMTEDERNAMIEETFRRGW